LDVSKTPLPVRPVTAVRIAKYAGAALTVLVAAVSAALILYVVIPH
jgi:hypothetical protein